MNRTEPVTPRRLFRAFILGGVVTAVIIAVSVVPKALHDEWLKRGSAYDVEYEYLYANILRLTREGLYNIGAAPEGFFDRIFKDWQQHQTEKAFRKIPEGDGERILWELWLDKNFWHSINKPQSTSAVMPRALKYFDALTTMPVASRWAETERLENANKLASFFFHNYYKQSDMSSKEVSDWQWLIIKRMVELEPRLDPKRFLNETHDYNRIEPLIWNSTILVGASHILRDPRSKTIHCNKEAIDIFLKSKKRLIILLDFYRPYISEPFGLKWLKRVSDDVNGDGEEVIRKSCPDY
jgi:hypothetical protein